MLKHVRAPAERDENHCAVATEFAKIPGLMVFLQSPPLITLGQNEGRSQYSLALQDADLDELTSGRRSLRASCTRFPS